MCLIMFETVYTLFFLELCLCLVQCVIHEKNVIVVKSGEIIKYLFIAISCLVFLGHFDSSLHVSVHINLFI